jgi:hypothetical protein
MDSCNGRELSDGQRSRVILDSIPRLAQPSADLGAWRLPRTSRQNLQQAPKRLASLASLTSQSQAGRFHADLEQAFLAGPSPAVVQRAAHVSLYGQENRPGRGNAIAVSKTGRFYHHIAKGSEFLAVADRFKDRSAEDQADPSLIVRMFRQDCARSIANDREMEFGRHLLGSIRPSRRHKIAA